MLAPSSPWNLNYADKNCRLSRVFGEKDNRHMLFFEQAAPGSARMLVLGGPHIKRFQSKRRAKLQIGDYSQGADVTPRIGDLAAVGPALIYPSVGLFEGDLDESDDPDVVISRFRTATDPQLGAGAKFVRVTRGKRVLDFATDDLAEPLAALTNCTFDLLSDWGLDPDEHRTASRLPVWTNQPVIARQIQASYPDRALLAGEQGVIRMRVIVGEDGSVSQCELENATETESLDSSACKAMRGAKFEPALNKDGEPMRSYYSTSIIYQIGQ